MTNKKIRTAILLIAVFFCIICIKNLMDEYPGFGIPSFTDYSSAPSAPTDKGSPFKYYYNDLSAKEKHAYNMILNHIYDMPEHIRVPSLEEDELNNVFSAILADNPDLFFLGRRCSVNSGLGFYYFDAEYSMSQQEYKTKLQEFNSAVDGIVKNLSDTEDQWQTELEIHDYIVDHCSYKIVEDDHIYSSSYGCLVNNEAGCEGYSKCAKVLFDKVGIESICVSGNSADSHGNSGPHMWNIVKINGNYYHLDCTWDDPVTGKGNMKTYSYFNISDALISKTHSGYSVRLICNSMDANYYNVTKKCFNTYNSNTESKIISTLVKEYLAGNKQIQFRFSDRGVYSEAYTELISKNRFSYIINEAAKSAGFGLKDSVRGYTENPELYTITIVFSE